MIASLVWNESRTAAIVNHLWQSTVFAGIAWLLTLALSKNQARTRYAVWMIASLKFLLPLSLLMAAGEGMRLMVSVPLAAKPAVTSIMAHVAQPLPQTRLIDASEPWTVPSHGSWPLAAALTLWMCGVLILALRWMRGEQRIRAARCSAQPLDIAANVPVLCSPTTIEPGIYGIFRPVLLLPDGILGRLTSEQLKAILAHEMCHVRRRDNLTFAIHMIVEALFWFHPAVWWIGTRLIEERERACDEAVLDAGNDAEDYAAGILNVCAFYVEPPLRCASGVTGSDLKERIRRIVTRHAGVKLPFRMKVLLGAMALTAIAVPVAFGLVQATKAMPAWQEAAGGKLEFAAASIRQDKSGVFKPPSLPLSADDGWGPDGPSSGGLFTADFHVGDYISFAFKLNADQREHMYASLPKWAAEENFEIHARSEIPRPTKDQLRLMMQSLLAERFKLAVHLETQQLPVFVLTLIKPGKAGPSLIPHSQGPPCDVAGWPKDVAKPDPSAVWRPAACGVYMAHLGPHQTLEMGSRDTTMDLLASSLSGIGQLGRPVVDGTGFSGRFDFTLQWTPPPGSPMLPPGTTLSPDAEGLTFEEALKAQLGMKLEPTKSSVQVMVVDHIERPSEN